MPSTPEEVFDRVEREVLDQAHRHLNLLFRNERDSVVSLLRVFAQILRDLRTGKIEKPNHFAKVVTANDGLRGLGHCLRWLQQRCPKTVALPASSPEQSQMEALELLRWAVVYDKIWNEHSAYRGGLVRIDVDEAAKTITFLPKHDPNPHFFCSQIEAKKSDDERLAKVRPESQLAHLSKVWFDSVTFSDRGMHFDDSTIRRSGAIEVAVDWLETTCLPELEGATKLSGCTVGELRRVLATLYVYSLFVTKLEDVADEKPSHGVALEPRVASRPRRGMIEWLAGLSGVSIEGVDVITSSLTFDPGHPHVTVGEQPFVATTDGGIHFLPRMILLLDIPRVFIGALNTMKESRTRQRGAVLCVEEIPVYGRLIGEIEDTGVTGICEELRRSGLRDVQIAEKRSYRLPDDQIITPDIVVVVNNREVLVIDVKYATPPFGPLDVRHDIKEVEKWRRRMSEYVEAFARHPEILAQHFEVEPNEGMTVRGLILLRWPFPVPVEFEPPVYAVDWPSLQEHLRNEPPDSIQNLVEWILDRPDLTVPAKLDWTAKTVVAADWTYRYFVLMPSAPTPSES
jgi:hypothetical protein